MAVAALLQGVQRPSAQGAPVSMFSRRNSTLVEPEQALPGRTERGFAIADKHEVLDAPSSPTRCPTATRSRSSAWAASGAPRRSTGRCPACGRRRSATPGGTTPHPSYEEVCSGAPATPRRSGSCSTRPGLLRRPACKTFFEVPRPDAGLAPGQRRRHPVPLGDLLHDARAGAGRARAHRGLRRGARATPATARSRPRSGRPPRRRTTTPRTTTSSTSRRTRSATAATPTPA